MNIFPFWQKGGTYEVLTHFSLLFKRACEEGNNEVVRAIVRQLDNEEKVQVIKNTLTKV